MTEKTRVTPDYLFEASWEVCNKVGGIHTVIATKALNLSRELKDNHILIGPDVWRDTEQNPEFLEEPNLLRSWRIKAAEEGLRIRVGRWNVAGTPVVVLVDFSTFVPSKDKIFASFWEQYKLDSLSGQWDYVESSLFGYAAGKVIESYVKFNLSPSDKVVAQFHEWMTGAGLLYLKSCNLPVATVFTTHATVVGRSIAGNNQPLYESGANYSAADKAREFNITAKHSLEKTAALEADIFTTVSDITAAECSRFLGRDPDIVTPNGFENTFTPKEGEYKICSKSASAKMVAVASAMSGQNISPDALMVGISGRYEYKNKGIDIFLDALATVNNSPGLQREIVAWIFVPAGHNGPDKQLLSKLDGGAQEYTTNTSHLLSEPDYDPVINRINQLHLFNKPSDKVKVLFVPSYLNGNDGVFNMTYYQLLCGLDITLFPSYYEPWGYTPLESLAFGVPTLTTTLAGFGLWVKDHQKESSPAIFVVERNDNNYNEVVQECASAVVAMTKLSKQERDSMRESAKELAGIALWDNHINYYKKAYDMAIAKIAVIPQPFSYTADDRDHIHNKRDLCNRPVWNKILVTKKLPKKLEPLELLSKNLWWCWNQEASELFESIDKELWIESEGNPIVLLDKLSLRKYNELESDTAFMEKLNSVYSAFQLYMSDKGNEKGSSVAYFSMEYGLDKSLKIYSGGLGVLAGDYLKEASDMSVPLTAVGILYKYGYFTQQISAAGEQIAHYEAQDFRKVPVTPVRDSGGNLVTVKVALPGRNMTARLWRADVGRRELILLDTDFEDNLPEDRSVTHHLYGGNWENRLKQEMLLGIGGVRALRALGIQTDVYHLNEGHAAFIGLERVKEYIERENLTFAEAVEVVRASSLYTTHTPVPAGHDSFSEELIRSYISHYPDRFKTTWEVLVSLGKLDPYDKNEKFSMSNLAANLSQEINGVSMLHGKVSREILSPLWPGYLPQELHVGHVTNGVHYPTWTAAEWKEIHAEVFGEQFQSHHYDKDCFKGIFNVHDKTIWQTRNDLRTKLIQHIKHLLSSPESASHYTPKQTLKIKEALKDDILTIGFARRFATYKRANLIFRDLDRLDKIVNNPDAPVQILFAGKAHPADKAGQDLIKRIVEISLMPQFTGRILFIPGYDMTLAKHMVQGVDVWMNTPTRPLEASGTSGEKAAMNGVMHFSVLDGWWVEGYRPGAGWALDQQRSYADQYYQDEFDATTIYNILENEIAPMFYRKEGDGQLPVSWISQIKNTIAFVAANFTTNRMLTDYINQYYSKLAIRGQKMVSDDFALAREIAQWKKKMRREWPLIEILDYSKPDYAKSDIMMGEEYIATLTLVIGDLSPEDVGAEILVTEAENSSGNEIVRRFKFKLTEFDKGVAKYKCIMVAGAAGAFNLAGRIYARNPKLPHRQDFDLVKWL